jgi:hypothetical protein
MRKIFKVLWPELSERTIVDDTLSEKNVDLGGSSSNTILVGNRRFIVIRNDFGHCTCVYVQTLVSAPRPIPTAHVYWAWGFSSRDHQLTRI